MTEINLAYNTINKLLRKDGKYVLEKDEFFKKVASLNKEFAKTIEKSVANVENPVFELRGKATGNYNIAILRIKSGDNIVGTGAMSKTQPDLRYQAEIKGRFDLPNGEMLRVKSGPINDIGMNEDLALRVYDGKTGNLKAISAKNETRHIIDSYNKGNNEKLRKVKIVDEKTNESVTRYYDNNEELSHVNVMRENGNTKIQGKVTKCGEVEYLFDSKGNRIKTQRDIEIEKEMESIAEALFTTINASSI